MVRSFTSAFENINYKYIFEEEVFQLETLPYLSKEKK